MVHVLAVVGTRKPRFNDESIHDKFPYWLISRVILTGIVRRDNNLWCRQCVRKTLRIRSDAATLQAVVKANQLL